MNNTFLHSRLLQTGSRAPHFGEVVILWNSTSDWAVSCFCALILLHHSELDIVYLLIIYELASGSPLIVLYAAVRELPWCAFCSIGNLPSLQCSADSYLLCLCPGVLLRLLLWFCNAMIIACHVGHFTGERVIGSLVLTRATSSSPLKYILHGIIMIWSVRGDGWGMTLD